MSTSFRFKQFEVDQTGSSMKINTDGVLLGASAIHPAPQHILDIGTGTGVIALMLAQRYSGAQIEAIDIDTQSAQLAAKNFQQSIFADRLSSYARAFQDFQPQQAYDLIVSNPPFFLNALTNADKRKSAARHTQTDFYEDLLHKTFQWLADGGNLQLVLPPEIGTYLEQRVKKERLFTLKRRIHLRSFFHSPAFRQILFFQKGAEPLSAQDDYFTLYRERGIYSTDYRALLQPFFLNF